jgi:ribosome-associated toxin RatA of RatAB toxin-antitoxin module
MHTENVIVMKAPFERVFETAADLTRWPAILPHYRWIRFLEQSPTRTVVRMAARRSMIPIQWTSELTVDRIRMEIRFHHLRAFTKGMDVVWTFKPTADGLEVRITHDLQSKIPIIGRLIAEKIIGRFFVHYVANKTLTSMKQYLETLHENPAVRI